MPKWPKKSQAYVFYNNFNKTWNQIHLEIIKNKKIIILK